MRVTGNRMIEMSANATAANQARVSAAAEEASSGLRVTKPSDDPAAWMAAKRAGMHKTLTEGATSALQAGRERLDLVDAALASIGDNVSQIRMLAVQGASAGYSAADRAGLGEQVKALAAAAVASANTQSADGEYLLAGTRSLTAPFSPTGVYAGDAIGRGVPSTESTVTSSAVTGSALTSANGVDVLPLLDRVATALSTNDMPSLQTALGELETAIKQVAQTRSHVGGVMNSIDASITATTDLDAHLTNEISRSVEADVIESATNLAKASQALEASRAVTSHIVALLDPK